MDPNQRSKTADAAAACRAWHLRYSPSPVFKDPFAFQLTSGGWRFILNSRILSHIVVNKVFKSLRPIFAEILGRARYTEEQLSKSISKGLSQYVVLSAGLDSFALRRKDLFETLKVYEVDHPASQVYKQKRLSELKLDIPDNLEFVSVDFEKESLTDGLARSSYSDKHRAFFSWLGTTPYLTQDAVFQTLSKIAAIAAPGSELVFDYMIPKKHIEPAGLPTVEALERFVARRSEPFLSSFDPFELPQEACRLGFELIEQVSAQQLFDKYFSGRQDNLKPIPNLCFIYLRLPA